MAAYRVEKILQIVIDDDDLDDEGQELTAELALQISKDIDTFSWQEIDRWAEDYS